MTKYTKLPQFDLEMQTSSGKTIQSITISRDTRPDGSTVRRKETLLSDGTCLVDERVVAPAPIVMSSTTSSAMAAAPSSSSSSGATTTTTT
eukprot:CAMPEP_0117078310 /NCGR_PEP_ID=MMETSP0472-20121206/55213_1 /TAXON_ID=693140 ORGANISM="Tiarina fusus, Strain LIS" /NCGR_SAMPLE_ID=MMETSP0472 /ASSEMBLY_ACC=CAM_ASM_000603 /LENGTH=90 /DNA_ID=CAMNT_0004804997 /DNA_START=26 /DNA_END=294 /DNA_ORIENTATION=+